MGTQRHATARPSTPTHAHRRPVAGRVFEFIAGPEAQAALPGVCTMVPLAAVYERVPQEGA